MCGCESCHSFMVDIGLRYREGAEGAERRRDKARVHESHAGSKAASLHSGGAGPALNAWSRVGAGGGSVREAAMCQQLSGCGTQR